MAHDHDARPSRAHPDVTPAASMTPTAPSAARTPAITSASAASPKDNLIPDAGPSGPPCAQRSNQTSRQASCPDMAAAGAAPSQKSRQSQIARYLGHALDQRENQPGGGRIAR